MFSRHPFDWRRELRRLPSAWHLAFIQAAALLAALLMFITLAYWSLGRELGEMSRARMQDELAQFAAIYSQGGLPAVRAAAEAPQSVKGLVRITNVDGRALMESQAAAGNGYPWQALMPFYLGPAQTDWHLLDDAQRKKKLMVGRIGLGDGNRLWYARPDQEEQAAAGTVTRRLFLLGGLAAVLGLVPVVWFVQRVLQPLRTLTRAAHRLAQGP
ncbi:MAG: hypothetical protein JWO94_1418, partial [Verrucomicrobiaceae bacterium]|nr:hypothetical protein [Verrucomicrobiaceae bacterium]